MHYMAFCKTIRMKHAAMLQEAAAYPSESHPDGGVDVAAWGVDA